MYMYAIRQHAFLVARTHTHTHTHDECHGRCTGQNASTSRELMAVIECTVSNVRDPRW